MSLKSVFAKVLLFAVLEAGALAGVPMTPDKIREILEMSNRARAEYVVKTESGDGDDPSKIDETFVAAIAESGPCARSPG